MNTTFETAVNAFFQKRPCEDATSAKRALVLLYVMMEDLSKRPELADNWFKVQQLQSWTPLRMFWSEFATHEVLPIRAAAKGNICEKMGTYGNDPEVARIAGANIEVMQRMLNSDDPMKLQKELAEHPDLVEAERLWVVAGFGRFTPLLVVRDLSEGE